MFAQDSSSQLWWFFKLTACLGVYFIELREGRSVQWWRRRLGLCLQRALVVEQAGVVSAELLTSDKAARFSSKGMHTP